jgi:hypothetical protein
MAERFDSGSQPDIIRAEMVAPFADAARLIHHKERDLRLFEVVHRFSLAQLLGRQKEELDFPLPDPLQALANFGIALRGIECGGRDRSLSFNGIHLILL